MTANPLVAGPVDTSTAFGGAGLLDSLQSLNTSLQSGDWVGSALSGVGVALDTVATAMDPLGSLIAAGLGWLMEHLEPLKGWLNDLTGDAGAVLGFAGTWDNVAAAMNDAGDELNRLVRSDLEAMSGASIAAYTAYANGLADRARAAGSSASAMGSALRTCSTIVQAVHDLVRDTLSQIIGGIISGALFAVVTVGAGAPKVIADLTARVSAVSVRIGRQVTAVVEAVSRLKTLLNEMGGILARLGQGVRGRLPGGNVAPAPKPGSVTPTHPSGMRINESGARRNYGDQMLDPHIHPNNVDIVGADYDPFGGMSRTDFSEYYHSEINKYGEPDWRWPPNSGAVPGTVTVRHVQPGETLILDRIGGGDGAYFSPTGTPFGERALPPDRLNFTRSAFEVNTNHPALRTGAVRFESSEIAGWFGQTGGGTQNRFLRSEMAADGSIEWIPMKQQDLIDRGLIHELEGAVA